MMFPINMLLVEVSEHGLVVNDPGDPLGGILMLRTTVPPSVHSSTNTGLVLPLAVPVPPTNALTPSPMRTTTRLPATNGMGSGVGVCVLVGVLDDDSVGVLEGVGEVPIESLGAGVVVAETVLLGVGVAVAEHAATDTTLTAPAGP